jgi:hypothetical protein
MTTYVSTIAHSLSLELKQETQHPIIHSPPDRQTQSRHPHPNYAAGHWRLKSLLINRQLQ